MLLNRRQLFRGATAASTAIIVPELWAPKRTYFLPPKDGWNQRIAPPGRWYLEIYRDDVLYSREPTLPYAQTNPYNIQISTEGLDAGFHTFYARMVQCS
jgi:hypothetical protein